MTDSFGTKSQLKVGSATYDFYSLGKLAKANAAVNRLPLSLKVLLENLLRHEDGRVVKREHIDALLNWDPKAAPTQEIAFTRGACCSRTSPGCRVSWTSRQCARRSRRWAAIRSASIRSRWSTW